jgi:hypothetical protein
VVIIRSVAYHQIVKNGRSLKVEYATIPQLTDTLAYVAESLSVEFDRWDEAYVSGPSLYFVVVSDVYIDEYADALGVNKWPVDVCRSVSDSHDAFVDAARDVAFSCDGAVVIAADGTIQEQMVRIKSPGVEAKHSDRIDHADWMGTKHLSAVEASVREEVLVAVTVSEEDGRVTIFRNGTFDDYQRDEIGGRWRHR